MKAIEILKEYKSVDYGCDMSDLHNRIEEAIAELEELKITRREWYQKGYNQAMKDKRILKQKVSEVFANTKIEDKSQEIRNLIDKYCR